MSPPRDLLIATGNPAKFREIVAVLGESAETAGVRFISLSDLPAPIPEPVEDQPTFAANARLKAIHYSKASGLWTLADDSGLVVDALDGAPGVLSARYAGADSALPRETIDRRNNEKLVRALANVPPEKRTARFRCALALADGKTILALCEASIEGRIVDQPRGRNGFGYDPHFLLPALGLTSAELSPDHKNRISHRGQALRQMHSRLCELLRPPFKR
jgi:XTP/dITP diphosphohydrolase